MKYIAPKVPPASTPDAAYAMLEGIMDDRLNRLLLDDYRAEIAERYDLTDDEVLALLGDVQAVLFPGRYDDPRLAGEGLVPRKFGGLGDARLILAASACEGGRTPMVPFDAAGDACRRARERGRAEARAVVEGVRVRTSRLAELREFVLGGD